ncbi:unnamed protein product, partial [Musa hybrid cultivar]
QFAGLWLAHEGSVPSPTHIYRMTATADFPDKLHEQVWITRKEKFRLSSP